MAFLGKSHMAHTFVIWISLQYQTVIQNSKAQAYIP